MSELEKLMEKRERYRKAIEHWTENKNFAEQQIANFTKLLQQIEKKIVKR